MTTKNSGGPAFPEPEAYLYVNGKHRGVSLNFHGDMDLSEGTVRHALITTNQAESYADSKVREALEDAAKIPRAYAESLDRQGWGNRFPDELTAIFNASNNMADRIRALIQQENKS